MIKLVGVEKTLGGQHVLQGIDLDIPAGKLTTIIGRSGEGKSVLLKHMIGLLQPDRGQVWVGDMEISRMRGKALNEVRKRFAMLFQGAALFDSLTVFENVAFPLREKLRMKGAEVSRRVDEKLEQVGLAGMGHKYPAELSGGMKKRAGLARALVMEPEIILFDEPTTGLDPLMAKSIHDLIVAMHQRFKFTAVMVSHEIPEIFGISDWVAMLRKGKIALMAPAAEFVKTTDPEIHEFISVSGPVMFERSGRLRRRRSAPMEKTKLEFIVGVFVLVGIVCLGYLSIKLGKLELIGGNVYEVIAQFNTASGLKAGSSVEIAGVEVGRVRAITLNEDRAAVILAVDNKVKLYTDTIASIKTRGIIGEKFLALSPGGGGDPLKPGDTIRDTESGLDLEELVSQYVHGNVK